VIDGHPRVELKVGRIRLDSTEKDDRRKAHVWAGPFEFVDIGTVFEVSRDANTVSLFVREGMVQVLRDAGPLANVPAGETWHGTVQDEPTSIAPPTIAPPTEGQRAPMAEDQHGPVARDENQDETCRKLAASGQQRGAFACYEDLARGSGLLAQTALYELANLRRDGGDPTGALATLRSYGVRFPNGALATEVELSMIELLVKSNQHREALERSAALLARQPNLERSSDLRVLRGNLYREAMGDLRRAATEYDQAQRGRGRAAVEALFLAATCAEALGDRESAARLYTRYLSHGDRVAHAADARSRLLAISSLKE
jgi:TolA-binding protein